MQPPLSIEEQPTAADLEVLEAQIIAYNYAQTGARDGRQLAIFVRDDTEKIIAGLSGYTWGGFCEIQFLWVDETLRRQGYGAQLLQQAEAEARVRGCTLIILGSYSFQAPDFYRRHGYEEVGRIADCPTGHTHHYFKKMLA
ncbi:MAG: GNAT family N-acetyltransferase [Caldilineaceae bacterium]